jgi:hypothetical protein
VQVRASLKQEKSRKVAKHFATAEKAAKFKFKVRAKIAEESYKEKLKKAQDREKIHDMRQEKNAKATAKVAAKTAILDVTVARAAEKVAADTVIRAKNALVESAAEEMGVKLAKKKASKVMMEKVTKVKTVKKGVHAFMRVQAIENSIKTDAKAALIHKVQAAKHAARIHKQEKAAKQRTVKAVKVEKGWKKQGRFLKHTKRKAVEAPTAQLFSELVEPPAV